MTASLRRRAGPASLAAAAFVVYLANARAPLTLDTVGARLLPFSLLREGNLDVDEFDWLRPRGFVPYFLVQDTDGHWRSKYPVVTSLLVTPLAYPFDRWARQHGVELDDSRFRLLAVVFERLAAALIAALSVAFVYVGVRAMAPAPWPAAVAMVYAFGTNAWATSSQALWQHGVAAAALAAMGAALLRGGGRRNAWIAGACVALAVGARPTTAVIAGVIALYFWQRRRADLLAFLAVPAAAAAALVAHNLSVLASPTGGYRTSDLRFPSPLRLTGLLISPSRGLVLYCPLAALALPCLWRGTRADPLRWLGLAVVAHALLFSAFAVWWGGHSYGPRYFSEVMPLLAFCAVPAARQLARSSRGRILLGAGVVWCVTVQVIGVYFDDNGWNRFPQSIDQRTERLWDWRDPQILRAVRAGWHGGEYLPLLRQLWSDPRPARLVPLGKEELEGALAIGGHPPWRFAAGRRGEIDVEVTNRTASTVWPAYSDFGDLEVGLLLVWMRHGEVVQTAGGFEALDRHLGPGETGRLRYPADVPPAPGAYDLAIYLAQNLGDRGRFGGTSVTVPVEIY